MIKKTLFIIFLFFIFSATITCRKDDYKPIPDTYVNFTINTSSTIYLNLNNVGGYEYLTGGYKGIVVYRLSNDEFMAYERACPHDWENDSAFVNVNSSGMILTCNACGSEYIITDGSNLSGPSEYPLKQYKTTFDGTYLQIYN